jgi:ATP phosphoribosyltransferase regulatory subunit
MLYESDADPVGLPDGVTFLSDTKNDLLDSVVDKISRTFINEGYGKVLPPIFEYYETFEKGSGYNIARKAFSFKDKDGKLLSLRYDMTTPIARMISMKYDKEDLPLKFYYRGDVFREQPIHAGKPRQLRQVGVEYIGEGDICADIEVINLAGRSLAALSDNYKLVLGDIRLFKNLVSQLKMNESQTKAVSAAFNIKDTVSLEKILADVEGIADYKRFLLKLPYMTGSIEKVLKLMDEFSELGFEFYYERLKKIVDGLDKDIKKNIIVDMGLVKDFSYYTSTTIEGYVEGVGYPVANGGRYDELFRAFGKDFPSIGFALDISYYQYK